MYMFPTKVLIFRLHLNEIKLMKNNKKCMYIAYTYNYVLRNVDVIFNNY